MTADRPADFDLSQEWDRVVDVVERQRAATVAVVVIAQRWEPVLRDMFGRHFELDGPAGVGLVRVRVSAPTPLMIAQNLAGWGAMIDVEGPEEVRAELARLGAELVDRYAVSGTTAGTAGPAVTTPG